MAGISLQILELAEKNNKFRAVDKAIGKNGFKVVTLLRLSPLLPLALSNYFYGLTSVDLASYVAGSWLGMLPGTVLYVIAGVTPRYWHSSLAVCAISLSQDMFILRLVLMQSVAGSVWGARMPSQLASTSRFHWSVDDRVIDAVTDQPVLSLQGTMGGSCSGLRRE